MIEHYLLCIRFTPGLLKEILCIEKNLRRYGYKTNLILNNKYKNLITKNHDIPVIYINNFSLINYLLRNFSNQRFKDKRGSSILIYNISFANIFVFIYFLFYHPSYKRVYVLHEPNKKLDFSFWDLELYKTFIINFINKRLTKLSTDIILLSDFAKKNYYLNPGFSIKCNIWNNRIILDKVNLNTNKNRKFHTFLGRVTKQKKIDWFLNFVEFCGKKGKDNNFLILSSSILPLSKISFIKKNYNNLTVINPKFLSDQEISKYLLLSKSVFIMHQITQSGVFVEAIRHGTPIILKNQNSLSNDIIDCSIVVEKNNNLNLLDSLEKIDKNFKILNKKCIDIFSKYYCSNNFKKYYDFLINE